MHKIFDIIERNNQLYMFLGNLIITDDNNKLIDAYKYNSKDSYLYILVTEIPSIEDNCIYFDDYFMPKFLKNKIRGDVVSRLKYSNCKQYKLYFKDKKFYATNNYIDTSLDKKELELISSIDEHNYIDIVKLIKNTKSLAFNFSYDFTSKKYKNSIIYNGKTIKELFFSNDDFVINIVEPLISMIHIDCNKVNIENNSILVYSDDYYSISVSNFRNEIILYLASKFKLDKIRKK